MLILSNHYVDNVYSGAALFIEMPSLNREAYMADDAFSALQSMLMRNPLSGEVIQGTGGLRKARISDGRRQKGRRGGLRLIYYWWLERRQFWLFSLYDKNTQDDLTTLQRRQLKQMLYAELKLRKNP